MIFDKIGSDLVHSSQQANKVSTVVSEVEPQLNSVEKLPFNKLMWFVYILLCKDKSLYIGSTNNINGRLKDHLEGKGGRYTRSHKVEKLVYREELSNKSEALKREIQLKRWPKSKKEALVAGKLI